MAVTVLLFAVGPATGYVTTLVAATLTAPTSIVGLDEIFYASFALPERFASELQLVLLGLMALTNVALLRCACRAVRRCRHAARWCRPRTMRHADLVA